MPNIPDYVAPQDGGAPAIPGTFQAGHFGWARQVKQKMLEKCSFKEAKTLLGRQRYASQIKNKAAREGCSLDEAKTRFGKTANDAKVAKVAADEGCTLAEAQLLLGKTAYAAHVAKVAKEKGCTEGEARVVISRKANDAKLEKQLNAAYFARPAKLFDQDILEPILDNGKQVEGTKQRKARPDKLVDSRLAGAALFEVLKYKFDEAGLEWPSGPSGPYLSLWTAMTNENNKKSRAREYTRLKRYPQ